MQYLTLKNVMRIAWKHMQIGKKVFQDTVMVQILVKKIQQSWK